MGRPSFKCCTWRHSQSPTAPRRANERMRERQRALLFELEQLAAETPQPTDLVSGWFEDAVAKRLIGARLGHAGGTAPAHRPWGDDGGARCRESVRSRRRGWRHILKRPPS